MGRKLRVPRSGVQFILIVLIAAVVEQTGGSLFDVAPDQPVQQFQPQFVDNTGVGGFDASASLAASKSLNVDGLAPPDLLFKKGHPPPPPPPYIPYKRPCKRDVSGQDDPAQKNSKSGNSNDDDDDDDRRRRAITTGNIDQVAEDFKKFLQDNKVNLSKEDEELVKKFKEHQKQKLAETQGQQQVADSQQKHARSVADPTAQITNATDAHQLHARAAPEMGMMGQPMAPMGSGMGMGMHQGNMMVHNARDANQAANLTQIHDQQVREAQMMSGSQQGMGMMEQPQPSMGMGMHDGHQGNIMLHARSAPDANQANATDVHQQHARAAPGMGMMGQPMMGQQMGMGMGMNNQGGMMMQHAREANASDNHQQQARDASAGMGMQGQPMMGMGMHNPNQGNAGMMMHARHAPEQAPNASDVHQQHARAAPGMGMMGQPMAPMGSGMGMNAGHQGDMMMQHARDANASDIHQQQARVAPGMGMMGQPMAPMGSGMGMGMHDSHQGNMMMQHARDANQPANSSEIHQLHARAAPEMGMMGQPMAPMGSGMGMHQGDMMMQHARDVNQAANLTPIHDQQAWEAQMKSGQGMGMMGQPQQPMHTRSVAQDPNPAANASDNHQQHARAAPQDPAANASDAHQQHARSAPQEANQANASEAHQQHARSAPQQPMPMMGMHQDQQPHMMTDQNQNQRRAISPKFGGMVDRVMNYFN